VLTVSSVRKAANSTQKTMLALRNHRRIHAR
jgi:hypothetical protein